MLEAKLERIEKELAMGACAIEDGVADINMAKNGLLNLIAYIQVKTKIEDELDADKGSIELVQAHLKWIKDFYSKGGNVNDQASNLSS